ncbi:MAG TPA: mannose-1-phosphate guanylyltransferase [Sphingobium sp.]|uniref:mannose-1-phosphate guanylyltransferase n=1 Tax=Sphingobium sp. TaxID=1912891 RepID=UPI002ED378BB
MNEAAVSLIPVVLSGGSGTRLWPLSRPEMPKQFLPLTGEETMLRLTLARTVGMSRAAAPIIIANGAHAELLEKQVPGDSPLILEPCARNTAPAIALAALAIEDPSAAMLVMPSDHVIADVSAFHAAIEAALPLVADGWLMTLGIAPDAPETGYGYIALGEGLTDRAQRVARFVEKPDLTTAEAMLAAGNHVWNAGIFLFRADAYLEALGKFRPDMLAAVTAAHEKGRREGRRILPDAESFANCPSDSIDYAVMEQSERVGCVPVDMGWSDVGSWDTLHAIADKDSEGNAAGGLATLIGSRNCLVRSDGPRISLVGVEDLIVVATNNDVMIVPRGQSQLVKKAAEAAATR